jgi:hypothetical protein
MKENRKSAQDGSMDGKPGSQEDCSHNNLLWVLNKLA